MPVDEAGEAGVQFCEVVEMKRLWVIGYGLLVGLTSCGPEHSGVIIQKRVIPAHSRMIMVPHYIGKSMILMPRYTFVPEEHLAIIRWNENGETGTESYSLGKQEFLQCKVGNSLFVR